MAALKYSGPERRRRSGVYGPHPKLNVITEHVTDISSPKQIHQENNYRGPTCTDEVIGQTQKTNNAGVASATTISGSGLTNENGDSCQTDTPRRLRKCSNDQLGLLKKYAVKLRLETRRPSYLKWKSKHIDSANRTLTDEKTVVTEDSVTAWTVEWKNTIDDAMDMLRNELADMREQDQCLAQHLMEIRRTIHDVKMSRYSLHHKELLDEAMLDVQRDDIDDICDLPPRLFSPALKQYGLTKMNVQTRRFSVF